MNLAWFVSWSLFNWQEFILLKRQDTHWIAKFDILDVFQKGFNSLIDDLHTKTRKAAIKRKDKIHEYLNMFASKLE